jgi:hypothetical protein
VIISPSPTVRDGSIPERSRSLQVNLVEERLELDRPAVRVVCEELVHLVLLVDVWLLACDLAGLVVELPALLLVQIR